MTPTKCVMCLYTHQLTVLSTKTAYCPVAKCYFTVNGRFKCEAWTGEIV